MYYASVLSAFCFGPSIVDSRSVLAEDSEQPPLVIRKDKVPASQSLGRSVVSRVVPRSLGLDVVVVRSLKVGTEVMKDTTTKSGEQNDEPPYLRKSSRNAPRPRTYLVNILLPIACTERSLIDRPNNQQDLLRLLLIDQQELSRTQRRLGKLPSPARARDGKRSRLGLSCITFFLVVVGILGFFGEGGRGLSTVGFVACCVKGLVTGFGRGVVKGLFDAG
jgi:hypothetical protein